MKPFVLLLSVALFAPHLRAQSNEASLSKLAGYAGTWKTETEHFDTKFSKARKESSTLRNECWRSGAYYACHQFVNGASAALIVYTYDAKADAYKSYVVPVDGGDAHSGKLLIQGKVWTFPWEDKDDAGKTYYFQVVNVWTAPDTIDYRTEFSDDKTHWTVAAKGHEHQEK